MFGLFKKKNHANDDKIVDKLIQLYADEKSIEKRVLDYVEFYAKTEHQKQEMMQLFGGIKQPSSCYDKLFDGFKKQLFGANKKGCTLTHLELAVCFFLLSREKYYPETVMDILSIEKEQLKQAVKSLEVKIADCGYKLPSSYIKMQPAVRSFFEVENE